MLTEIEKHALGSSGLEERTENSYIVYIYTCWGGLRVPREIFEFACAS